MRELLISLRNKLALARRETDTMRMVAFVIDAHEQIEQALLAVPQYEDMQKDLSSKNEQIERLEADKRALMDTLESILSDATATFTAIEGEPVEPKTQIVDIHDIARKCAGIRS